uniref:Venom S1 protease 8 n=1 Tax=Ectomocoris sp. TaxID=3104572 RepID=A0AB38ZE67_9HEMI
MQLDTIFQLNLFFFYFYKIEKNMCRFEVFLVFLTLGHCLAIPVEDEIDSSEHGVTPGRISTNCTCGLSNKSPKRIIGGKEAGVNEWPMMAAIIITKHKNWPNNVYWCGGTVITHRHILTAGHCLHDDDGKAFEPKHIGVILAAHNLNKLDYNDPNVLRSPEKLIKHPEYEFPVSHDMGLIIMPYITFSRTIGPACLPTERFNFVNKRMKVTGWGFTKPSGPVSDVLKKTDLIGITQEKCAKVYKNVIGAVFDTNYQMCTFQPGTSDCSGDSGGPIMWVDKDINRYVLVAAPSYGGSGCKYHPGVNSDVTYFIPWIQQTISETYPEEKTCSKAA